MSKSDISFPEQFHVKQCDKTKFRWFGNDEKSEGNYPVFRLFLKHSIEFQTHYETLDPRCVQSRILQA